MSLLSKSLQNSHVTCPECQVGSYQLKLVTYYTWLGQELITVPDFPCWVCDVCRRFDFDEKAISQLSTMLNANLGNPISRAARSKKKIDSPRTRRSQRVE